MFGKVAAFEFRYQLRQPAFWVISILFFLLSFGSVASPNVSLGTGGNVLKNAPFAIAQAHLSFTLFFMLATTAIVANVVVRDVTSGFGPMIQSSRLSKFDYLYGRFLGAFGVVALAFLSVALGMLIGTLMPWVDKETIGAFRPLDYLYGYVVMGLPGVFFSSAVFFMLATVTRSMMATYVGVVAVFILYMTTTSVFGSKPELETLVAWLEPFGAGAYGLATKYWTAAERNTINAPLTGVLLGNKLLWLGVSAFFLAVAYPLYRPSPRGAKLRKQEKLRALADAAPETVAPTAPLAAPSYGFKASLTQLISRTGFEMKAVFKSPAYFIMLALGFAFSIAVLLFAGEIYGAPILPVTRVVIETLGGSFGLVAMIIAIYYSGELVWRDRERRTHEIIDATSTPDWTFLLPKTLALILVLASTLVAAAVAGILVQTFKGYTDYEIGKYLAWYVAPEVVSYALLAILAVFIQSLSPNKFVGWAVMVVYLISTIVLSNLGFDHILYRYASGTGMPLSDMNGTGKFAIRAAWMQAYWASFAIVLLVIAYGLWRRGAETRFLPRLKRLPRRLMGPAGAVGGLALTAFVALGVYVFINTNVWNEYRSRDQQEQLMADYEKTLLKYEKTPQPEITDVKLDLDLYPHQPRLTTKGTYVIENRTGAPLNEVHLRWNHGLKIAKLEVQGATVAKEWPQFEYRIYRFATPMQPGEKRTIAFETVLEQRGFKNSGDTTRVVDNGTFVNNGEFGLTIGMGRDGLLSDRAKRRKHGLPAELRMAKLEDVSALNHNYIGSGWVNADITVTTVADQTPIAPGYKVSDVTKNGRRTARFVTEAPVLNFFSVQSADYQVAKEQHGPIELAVYYHQGHERNVPRMLTAMKTSLDYYGTAFSPYQFRQARIIEFPAYASFAQAFANTMPYSEGLGFIADLTDEEKIDYVTYITAHEVGHQWWAHQVIGSNQQGSTLLSESLAQYSALMVMEKLYGPDKIRRFLKYELDRYLRSRGMERLEETPLLRIENQQYIHYQKGGLVMYLLRDQIGEEAVNRALRRVLAQYAFKPAPYPRSLDLLAAIRAEAPADKQALITDLFEKITLYDVKTKSVTATRRADGKWDVALTVEARKLYADGKGEETEAPLKETFEIGLFSAEPGKGAFDRKSVILMERRPVRSGTQVFRFVTDKKPSFAGVDPYNRWIDRNSDDNVKSVD
ncbi:ABC transporter permease/M1 family aminopeptidase [Brevundimonas faecalis]|uniref:ABC-2 type transport system permease protein n=1 Tax=Brevundimonas faecalis TaxID=947378 RepID=A0ABV2RAJ8_9CAUL